MENKPFIGEFSGFLFIGEEKAEYDGELLVSYYAKPYSSDTAAKVKNCIEFRNDRLIIRDAKSPDGKKYSCIWEQEDIESVLDKLCNVSAYRIEKISCKTITQLVIPSGCAGIEAGAFDDCPDLEEIICLGEKPEFGEDSNIEILSFRDYLRNSGYYVVERYTSDDIPKSVLSELKEHSDDYYYDIWMIQKNSITPKTVLCVDDSTAYDRYILPEDTEKISAGSFKWGKWILIPSGDIDIEVNAIDKDITIYAVSGGNIEAYAKQNGNRFIALDADIPSEALSYERVGDNMVFRKTVTLYLEGLTDKQNSIVSGQKIVPLYGDELNSALIHFETENDHQFAGGLRACLSLNAAFLAKKGFLRLENCRHSEKNRVTCDIVWSEPHHPNYDRWMYLCSLFSDITDCCCEIESVKKNVTSIKNVPFRISAFDAFCRREIDDQKFVLGNQLMNRLYIPGCELSEIFSEPVIGDGSKQISMLTYTDNNCYYHRHCKKTVELRVKNGGIYARYQNGKENELTGTDREFAAFYINHYRQCFNLPPVVLKEE